MSRVGIAAKSCRGATLCAVSLFALLAACAPTLQSAEMRDPASLQAQASFAAAPAAAWPSDHWWDEYGDAQLASLIEEGLRDAPSLQAAAARVRRANAYSQAASSAFGPQVGVDASVNSVRQSLNNGFPDEFKDFLPQGWNENASVAVRIDQQIDLFGRARAQHAAARADADVARAEEAAARLQLSTAIALAYADLSRLSADRAAVATVVDLRTRSLDLVQQRVSAELENDSATQQATSELASARAELIAVDGQLTRTRNQIAALLGEGPDRGQSINAPATLNLRAPGLPTNLSADLIGRRPDIAAARLRAEAASDRVRVARADFYPNINLVAIVGQQSLGLDLLGESDSRFGQVGPAISLPIFSSGRLTGAYRAAGAGYDESVALYNQTLADALRDVADALSDRTTLAAQLEQSRTALAAAEEAYRLAQLRYNAGLQNYIETLTVENRLVAQRRAVADLQSRAFAVDVALVRALGGGFDARTADLRSGQNG